MEMDGEVVGTMATEVNEESFNVGLDFEAIIKDLDDKVKSFMVMSENLDSSGKRKSYKCTVCGREGYYGNIKVHIEAVHIEGISLPCRFCGKVFKTRDGLCRHQATHTRK